MKISKYGLKFSAQKKVHFSGIIVAFILLFYFQNCSQPGAINVTSAAAPAEFGSPVVLNPPTNDSIKSFSSNTFANTELNTPIDFTLEPVTQTVLTGIQITDSSFQALNGTLTLLDAQTRRFRYTPNLGYRGSDSTMIKGIDDTGRVISFNVKIVIDNPVQNLKPALAIRGMACIQCHAKVESNIVTDFGFGSPYYFSLDTTDTAVWKSGGLYGDHTMSFSTMDLNSALKVIVPKANLPGVVARDTGKDTLANYIRSRFSVAEFVRTKSVVVEEKSKVYIGAPQETDIVTAFSMKSSDRSIYFKNADTALALSGFSDKGTYFKNNGTVNCEGDLALRGPLYLENLQVNSASGCRIYVIGSVFVYGAINQSNINNNRNLQITSTKSISLGLGLTKKNNAFCEPDSRFAKDPNNYNVSSMKNRYVTFWSTWTNKTRGSADPVASGNAIIAESAAIEHGEGTLYDASCRAEGRNISFDRLLLNAPAVHSRYEGNFIGTVIAEYSIMSLNQFKFQYDPVFDRTPILPMLKHEVYLDIQQ